VTERPHAASSQRHSLPECTGTIARMNVIDGVLEGGGTAGQRGSGAVCGGILAGVHLLPSRPTAQLTRP
jgi:hypothetical protein